MNAHTKQQDKVFQTDFIDSQKSDPPFAHLLALSHIAMQQLLRLAWNTLDSGGGGVGRGAASLQIKNAQLKLHFSSCMLVLAFE